jgi:electron transfer flavoprotein beta subunit
MKIIVCVKQVARITIQNGFDPNTKDIVSEGLIYILNPYDEIATEEAIRQKEKADEGEVTVITIGPSRAEDALRWCLALGADKAVHVLEDNSRNLDSWGTASILADLIKGMEYDLLLFGKKAIDDEMGQVGIFVAELLQLPVVTAVTQIESVDADRAKALRALERGNREEISCPMPAVFTVEKMLNRPRYPTFSARKAAQTKSIQQIDIQSFPAYTTDTKMVIHRLAPPKPRPKRILAPDSHLSAADKIKFVMAGGMSKKKGGAVGGDPKQIVSTILDFLIEKKVINK